MFLQAFTEEFGTPLFQGRRRLRWIARTLKSARLLASIPMPQPSIVGARVDRFGGFKPP